MKNRIEGWVKRYFLSIAGYVPFVAGLLLGMVPAVVIGGGVQILTYPQETLVRYLVGGGTGFGVVLGILNEIVCRRFVSYYKGPGLFFLTNKGGEIILDADGKATAANPLWGKSRIWIWLCPTDRPYKIDPAPTGGWGRSLMLRAIFERDKSTFDAQEVHREIVGAGYHSFEELVRREFEKAVRLCGLEGLFGQLRARSPAQIERKLGRLQTHFDVAGRFDNVKEIRVEVAPKTVVSLY